MKIWLIDFIFNLYFMVPQCHVNVNVQPIKWGKKSFKQVHRYLWTFFEFHFRHLCFFQRQLFGYEIQGFLISINYLACHFDWIFFNFVFEIEKKSERERWHNRMFRSKWRTESLRLRPLQNLQRTSIQTFSEIGDSLSEILTGSHFDSTKVRDQLSDDSFHFKIYWITLIRFYVQNYISTW